MILSSTFNNPNKYKVLIDLAKCLNDGDKRIRNKVSSKLINFNSFINELSNSQISNQHKNELYHLILNNYRKKFLSGKTKNIEAYQLAFNYVYGRIRTEIKKINNY